MSTGVRMFSVDHLVWNSIGSHDDELLDLLARNGARVAREIGECLPTPAGAQRVPTAWDALRHLVLGEPYDPRLGSAYARWLEHVCEVMGESLPTQAWRTLRVSFVDDVREALQSHGATEELALDAMFFGGSPIALPPIPDFPSIGFTSKVDIATKLEALRNVNAEALPTPAVRQAVQELRGWLLSCQQKKRDLICFYG